MPESFIHSIRIRSTLALDDNFMFSFLQVGVLITFLITAMRAWRVSPSRLRELVTAFIFGLLLEEGDILIFGTYSYNPHWITIGYVPIAIAMTWAMIIASAMNFSDALGLQSVENLPRPRSPVGTLRWLARGSLAPIADAVWAIILDLSLDAVAIRLKLWTWQIPLDQGWFGVPWGNFYSWLFVALMFSFFTRLVRHREAKHGRAQGWWQLAVPLLAYAGLLASFVPFIAIQVTVLAANRENTAPIFLVALAGFIGITGYGLWSLRLRPREQPDRWLIIIRGTIHLTFVAALFLSGIFMQLPVLLWVALAMLVVEMIVALMLRRAFFRFAPLRIASTPSESRSE
jgi:hypothetical protein